MFPLPLRESGKGWKVGPPTANIPSPTSPRAIPLRSLPDSNNSVNVLESASEKGSRRSSQSSAPSAESGFSIWSDTGDLAEQLAEVEDPLQTRLRSSLNRELLGRHKRKKHAKRVHYPDDKAFDVKTDALKIQIPIPPPRRVSRVERLLARIMSPPRSGQNAQMHGLVGKPLL